MSANRVAGASLPGAVGRVAEGWRSVGFELKEWHIVGAE
jgi:hypothetical protein